MSLTGLNNKNKKNLKKNSRTKKFTNKKLKKKNSKIHTGLAGLRRRWLGRLTPLVNFEAKNVETKNFQNKKFHKQKNSITEITKSKKKKSQTSLTGLAELKLNFLTD